MVCVNANPSREFVRTLRGRTLAEYFRDLMLYYETSPRRVCLIQSRGVVWAHCTEAGRVSFRELPDHGQNYLVEDGSSSHGNSGCFFYVLIIHLKKDPLMMFQHRNVTNNKTLVSIKERDRAGDLRRITIVKAHS